MSEQLGPREAAQFVHDWNQSVVAEAKANMSDRDRRWWEEWAKWRVWYASGRRGPAPHSLSLSEGEQD
jgi:hypothetical protein